MLILGSKARPEKCKGLIRKLLDYQMMVQNSWRFEVLHGVLRDRDRDSGRGRMPEFIPSLEERTHSSGSSQL